MRVPMSVMLAWVILTPPAHSLDSVHIVSAGLPIGPARYGIAQLADAISDRGIAIEHTDMADRAEYSQVIIAGLASQQAVAELIRAGGLAVPEHPEAFSIRCIRDGHRMRVVLCGGGPVGLMYGALETAERIGWVSEEEDLFAHIDDMAKSPCLTERSVSTYTMQRRLFEQRLYDTSYWEEYFDLLARSRINSYVIIFGYENGGFMAPLYPYFFDVEGFHDVQLYGMTEGEQARNTAAFRRLIELAHERGIRVTAGIWDHIYRGGVQAGGIAGADELAGKKAPHLVSGLTAENLAPYTKAALRKFLTVFPAIDGIQFRMHWESGLTREETPGFWRDVFAILRELQPGIQIDLRAKDLPDEVIDDAVKQKLNFRIATKYWMEQLGMPFHPTHINPQNQKDRRHGYADLLRYPKTYDMHWRLWNGGTTRFLLWGDPQYVRRFVDSARIFGGKSFEVNEMLATKMLGEPHNAEPFDLLTPAYRHYRYEFERYWHYYQVWGRVSYDPNVTAEVWEREFVRRFGPEAGPRVMHALHAASNILPRVVAASYNYQYFPTTRGWAEMMRLGDLAEYAQGTGTDVEQFQSYRDAAVQLLENQFTTKRTPFQTSHWFNTTADQVLADVDAASGATAGLEGGAAQEFRATITDLKILARLAKYHASRMKAAVWYNVYLQSQDEIALGQCITDESQAVDQWRKVIESAGDVYPKTLKFGVHRVGFSRHWTEELTKLEENLHLLQELPSQTSLSKEVRERILRRSTALPTDALAIRVNRVSAAEPGQNLVITAEVQSETGVEWVRLRYRHLTQFEDYETVNMTFDPDNGTYAAVVPGSFVVPEWDLMYFVESLARNGEGRMAPNMDQEMPYVIVPVVR